MTPKPQSTDALLPFSTSCFVTRMSSQPSKQKKKRKETETHDFYSLCCVNRETACDRSKHKRQYNAIVFGASSTDRELCGRKIDLLVRYGRDTKDLELSSNEFKKPSITASNAITQQCKNLRVNGAILNHLHGLNKKIDSLLAMDWIGESFFS